MQPITQSAPVQRTHLLWQEAIRRAATVRQPMQAAHRSVLSDLCHSCEPATVDRDADGVPDAIDNCRGVFNPGQSDFDGDGLADECDPDDDNDGDRDAVDPDPFNAAVTIESRRRIEGGPPDRRSAATRASIIRTDSYRRTIGFGYADSLGGTIDIVA